MKGPSSGVPSSTTLSDTAERAPPQTVGLVLATLLGAVALNLHHTAVWCAPLALLVAVWRARTWRSRPKLPGGILRATAVIVLTAAALLDFRSGGSLGAAASLLVVMAALKLSETSSRRDWLVVLSAALFLLLAAVLDAQALWRLPLYAIELWLLCSGLYALGAGREAPSPTLLLLTAGKSLAAALPLAVVLFLFFPRLPGAFWAVPNQNQALTGLGNELSPGSITQLISSNEPALRVRFDGDLPPLNERYWRGPVLHDFDGFSWFRVPQNLGQPNPLLYSGKRYGYEVTLEPNEHRVLIGMDTPSGQPPPSLSAFWTYDYQLISMAPLIRPVTYQLTSYARHRDPGILSAAERAMDLDLRHQYRRNPRSVELAHEMRARAGNDDAYVSAVLDYLRQGGFSYTVDPPPLGRDSIDDLLFHTRQGFCGHYASAFALLMRAGGIPAHVVTGYLGGEWNRFGDYLLVRQSAAHAWDEVWLQGRGWVRVDPTAVVSPSSLSQQLAGDQPNDGGGAHLASAPWLVTTVQAWQAANAWWQDRVVGFNFNRQLGLLDQLGVGAMQWRALAWLLGVGGAVWFALMAWTQRPRGGRSADALTLAWRALERKLELSVAIRAPSEGPLAFAERVSRLRPELGPGLRSLARRYARLRYGPPASATELAQFRQAVRTWRPRLRSKKR